MARRTTSRCGCRLTPSTTAWSICFNYHSTVAVADGKTGGTVGAPALLDFANPANKHVQFWMDARDVGESVGPVATTARSVRSVPAGSSFYATTDNTVTPWNINRAIPGLTTLNTDSSGNRIKFAYDLNSNTPTGTELCFSSTIAPHDKVGDPPFPSDNEICYVVKNDKRYPSAISLSGDVHAGGSICGAMAPLPGSIIGHPLAGSYGEYMVSATGPLISGFGSDGNSVSTALTWVKMAVTEMSALSLW